MNICDNCKKDLSISYVIFRTPAFNGPSIRHELCKKCLKWVFPEIDLRKMAFWDYNNKKENCCICNRYALNGWMFEISIPRENEQDYRVLHICGTCYRSKQDKLLILKL